ncbi:synaptogyrin-2-like [Clavelina lepadiformis]|uniref:Synaptogyrin n=1 Tax=Clavelina lepadiformis TaxID=159417 RepID=A0ABP0G8J8_CLALP
MDEGGAYGAGKAGEPFHPIEFLKRPRTILRLLSWVFAIIVFGCIVSESYDKKNECIFGQNDNACHYGVAIGIMGFIIVTVFFVVDLIFPSISSAEKRKKIVMADMFFSGVWTFLFFVGFCFLTNAWANRHAADPASSDYGADNARAAIAFLFFSILSWGGLTYIAVQAYRQGALSAFAPTYSDPAAESSAPYTSFPGAAEMSSPSSYQQGPFSQEGEKPSYQAPPY